MRVMDDRPVHDAVLIAGDPDWMDLSAAGLERLARSQRCTRALSTGMRAGHNRLESPGGF